MMDNDFWLVERTNSQASVERLCSPGGNSSGYCSSDDSLSLAQTAKHLALRKDAEYTKQLTVKIPDPVMHNDLDGIAKTNASFDGFAESLWVPLTVESNHNIDTSSTLSHNALVRRRRVYGDLMTKHFIPTKNQRTLADDEIKFSQSMSEWNSHFTSELGGPFSTVIDVCSASLSASATAGVACKRESDIVPRSIPVGSTTHSGATLTSCVTSMKHSATVPSSLNSVSGQGLLGKCGPFTSKDRSLASCKVRSGNKLSSLHEALRDHMYALQPRCSVSSSGKTEWTKTCQTKKHSYCSSKSCSSMSILEALLRSKTQWFDANRGSNELVTEELCNFRVSGAVSSLSISVDMISDDESTGNTSDSPSLLKQLLTRDGDDGGEKSANSGSNAVDTQPSEMAVDSLLTDGFGLDAGLCLDDPLSNGIGLLDDDENGSGCVIGKNPMLSSCDLNSDIVSEQSRQDHLWWQHYITEQL